VVLVTITVLTVFVFGLDSLFTRFVFDVLGGD
jgi:preprotein translocase subunit SecE